MIKWYSLSLCDVLRAMDHQMYMIFQLFQKPAFHDLAGRPPPPKKKKNHIIKIVITATSGGGVFFQASALFCINNKKF